MKTVIYLLLGEGIRFHSRNKQEFSEQALLARHYKPKNINMAKYWKTNGKTFLQNKQTELIKVLQLFDHVPIATTRFIVSALIFIEYSKLHSIIDNETSHRNHTVIT